MASESGRPPTLSNEAVSKLLNHLYAFEHIDQQTVKELPSYEDRNYYFTGRIESLCSDKDLKSDSTRKGKEYVLKIYNCVNNSMEVVCGVSALIKHLCTRHFSGTELVRARDGEDISSVTGANLYEYGIKCGAAKRLEGDEITAWSRANTHCVRVMVFVPGEPLSDIRKECLSPQLLYDIGQYLGSIDTALNDGFTNKALSDRTLTCFDLMHFQAMYHKYISTVEDPQKRKMTEEIYVSFTDNVAPYIPSFKQGIIYNDPSSHNLVLGSISQNEYEVIGCIDYDDAVYSCYVFDLGIILAHMIIDGMHPEKCTDPVTFMASLVSGYTHQFPLTQEELSSLYSLVMARCCQLAMVSVVRGKKDPCNTYLARIVDLSWKAVEFLVGYDKTEANRVWTCAVGKTRDSYI